MPLLSAEHIDWEYLGNFPNKPSIFESKGDIFYRCSGRQQCQHHWVIRVKKRPEQDYFLNFFFVAERVSDLFFDELFTTFGNTH